jgi:hypothetical protein
MLNQGGGPPRMEPKEALVAVIRIKGLVRVAERVRRELASPMSPEQRERLRRLVAESLGQVRQILSGHGASLSDLPAPSRRAFQFLSELNLDTVPAVARAAPAAASAAPVGNVRLIGLASFWKEVLDLLAQASTIEATAATYDALRKASIDIERYLKQRGLSDGRLTPQSRTIRGWLAFFADRANFDDYVAALQRAKPALEAALRADARFQPPALIHFRPVSGLCGVRGSPDATRLLLPTPMITFSAELFGLLARALSGAARDTRPILEALTAQDCQGIQAELNSLGGLTEQTAGVYHDLAASFERVSATYFDGHFGRPRLTWSRTFTGRKFGHYDPIRDTVMISCTLDQPNVPVHALDFVMYHELLHKHLGVGWHNGRTALHAPEFRSAEQCFERYAEAEQVLQRLALEQ